MSSGLEAQGAALDHVIVPEMPQSLPQTESETRVDVAVGSSAGDGQTRVGRLNEVVTSNAPNSPSRHGAQAKKTATGVKENMSGKKRVRPASQEPASSDGNDCPICFEPCEKSGPHRLACLKCGHLIGLDCAQKCLKQKKVCPICKVKCSVKDIRLIYGAATRVVVTEQPELDAYRERLDEREEVIKKQRAELNAAKASISQLTDCNRLLRAAARTRTVQASPVSEGLASKHAGSSSSPPGLACSGTDAVEQAETISLHLDLQTCGESSALAFDPAGSVLVSEAAGSGSTCIRRFSLVNPDILHRSARFPAAQVSCLSVCVVSGASSSYIAAACADRMLRILDSRLRIATTYSLPAIPRSCCWLPCHPSIVLVALSNGIVQAFDIASTSLVPLTESKMPSGRFSPAVHSLVPILGFPGVPSGSILAASISSLALLSFGDTTGFSMRVEAIGGFEQCGAASTCGSLFVLSSRDVATQEGKHSVFDRISRTGAVGDESRPSGLMLECSFRPAPLTGYKPVRPFQQSAIVRLTSGEALVVSDDSHSARAWVGETGSGSSARSESAWRCLAVPSGDTFGPVKGIEAIVPPVAAKLPPLVAILYSRKLSVFKTQTGESARRARSLLRFSRGATSRQPL